MIINASLLVAGFLAIMKESHGKSGFGFMMDGQV